MFCSACGTAIPPGAPACPQCGVPLAPPVPPVPSLEFELARYRSNIRALGIVWFVYAGLSIVLGFAAMTFAKAFFAHGGFGSWSGNPFSPEWMGIAMRFAWSALLVRCALAAAVGVGLLERAQWKKILAIIAAILSLIRFPLGTALGIWTLVMLLGYRNARLYEQL